MKQQDLGLTLITRRTRKEVLLDGISLVMPWAALVALIAVSAPVAKTGRPPFDLEMILRIHCMQQWFGLSDLGAEEALFEMSIYRDFCGLKGINRIPDRVSILRFRHLLEEHDLSQRILRVINDKLSSQVLRLKTYTVVGATLIAAPSSTKNRNGKRDPQMRQIKKGNQWHFVMKAHIGVDADSGLGHTVIDTAAYVHDVTQGHALLHGDEQVVFADADYQGAATRPEDTNVDWHVAMRPGKRKQQEYTPWGGLTKQAEKLKASVRAKVENPFRVIKRQFGHTKVHYRGLAKNMALLVTLFALSNIWIARRGLVQRASA